MTNHTITFHGTPIHLIGDFPTVGQKSVDFSLVDKELKDISLSSLSGARKLISIVPSLDTPVCATSTKLFNEAAKARPAVHFLVVSSDLPFAMKRFCGAEGVDNIVFLSTMRSDSFAKDYGVLIQDGPLAGLTGRAVLVLDEADQIVYADLVAEVGDEPDYDAALKALDA